MHPSSIKRFRGWARIIVFACLILSYAACLSGGVGDTDSLVADLEAEISSAAASGSAPSIQVAVIQQDQIIWSRAFGEETSVDHVYMNASVQKMFTAVAVLQMVERGLVNLDADVQEYVPFPVRHPSYPDIPITVRMLLAHRSGMADFPNQFEWDTACAFTDYRPYCPTHLVALTPEEFLGESLTHDGTNYQPGSWGSEPGQEYYYSVSAYPVLRYMIGEVSGLSYPEYMQVNIFEPLGMILSSFNAAEYSELHTIPYTRVAGGNSELPLWDGQGWMMHTTAEDMAAFALALMNNGLYNGYQILGSESIELMQEITSSFRALFKSSDDMPTSGYGLGLFSFQGGWYGFGGSAPGYQSLLRYHPTRQVGYVILTNVNGILSSEYGSARSEIYIVQDALVSILDPTLALRYLADEMMLFAAAGLVWSLIMRTKASILAATGIVWIVAGGAWALIGTSAGLGLVATGMVSLVWGGISLLKARRNPTGPDTLDEPTADR